MYKRFKLVLLEKAIFLMKDLVLRIDWDVLLHNISLIFIVFFHKNKKCPIFCQFLCHENINNNTLRGIKKLLPCSTLEALFLSNLTFV